MFRAVGAPLFLFQTIWWRRLTVSWSTINSRWVNNLKLILPATTNDTTNDAADDTEHNNDADDDINDDCFVYNIFGLFFCCAYCVVACSAVIIFPALLRAFIITAVCHPSHWYYYQQKQEKQLSQHVSTLSMRAYITERNVPPTRKFSSR